MTKICLYSDYMNLSLIQFPAAVLKLQKFERASRGLFQSRIEIDVFCPHFFEFAVWVIYISGTFPICEFNSDHGNMYVVFKIIILFFVDLLLLKLQPRMVHDYINELSVKFYNTIKMLKKLNKINFILRILFEKRYVMEIFKEINYR